MKCLPAAFLIQAFVINAFTQNTLRICLDDALKETTRRHSTFTRYKFKENNHWKMAD